MINSILPSYSDMESDVSAIILIGGMATRAGGRAKYLFQYQGKTFLEWQIETLSQLSQDLILVCRDEFQCQNVKASIGIRCVADIRYGQGPVGGIHAGALAARCQYLIVTACDMPLIKPPLIRYLVNKVSSAEAAVPMHEDGHIEPLHAVYNREAVIRSLSSKWEDRMSSLISRLNTIFIPVSELSSLDPGFQGFININDLNALEVLSRSTRSDLI